MLQYTRRYLPWFYELHEVLGDDDDDEREDGTVLRHGRVGSDTGNKKNPFEMVRLADRVTENWISDGMVSPLLMGIANRRRIWNVCEQLAESYFRYTE